jgi:peptide/nickel transport system substrate-binding protein
MRLRNTYFSLVAITIVLLIWTGCVEKRELKTQTVVVHMLAEPNGLHPVNNNDGYQNMIMQCTQKKLVQLDIVNNELIPDALETLPEILPDSQTYRCVLRKNMRWDNGKWVSVDDAIFSIKAIICPGVNAAGIKSIFDNVASIEKDTKNPNAFIVRMKKKYFDNRTLFSFVILLQEDFWDPSKALRTFTVEGLLNPTDTNQLRPLKSFTAAFNHPDKARAVQQLDGLGPYKVVAWENGQSISLEKKANWWGDASNRPGDQNNPDRIVFKVIRDMEALILALKREEVDFTSELSAEALERLQKDDKFSSTYNHAVLQSFSYTYMGLNMKPGAGRTPYFSDKKLRKAMACLMPVDEIIAVVARGKAAPIDGFILPAQKEYQAHPTQQKQNEEKAAQWLDEAGWTDSDNDGIRDKVMGGKRVPLSISVSYMISPVTEDLVRIIKNAFFRKGVEIRPNGLEFSAFYEQAYAHNFDAMLGAWSSSSLAEDPRQIWHSESWSADGSNFVGFTNARCDSLIERANTEMNPTVRKRIMNDLQTLVQEEQPYVFLYNATKKVVLHKRFGAVKLCSERPHIWIGSLSVKQP